MGVKGVLHRLLKGVTRVLLLILNLFSQISMTRVSGVKLASCFNLLSFSPFPNGSVILDNKLLHAGGYFTSNWGKTVTNLFKAQAHKLFYLVHTL